MNLHPMLEMSLQMCPDGHVGDSPEHEWELVDAVEWWNTNGYTKTEKCKYCGLVARTGVSHYLDHPKPLKGNRNGTSHLTVNPCPVLLELA